MPIYLNIKNIANRKNVQQKDIAEAFGVTENTMTNYLTGRTKITADQIPLFAKVLRVSIADLFQEAATPLKTTYPNEDKMQVVEEMHPCPRCGDKDKLILSYEKQIALLELSLGKCQKNG